jgi:hypothetical protein
MPYYFNRQEPEEVRIASYLLIASTNPPRPMLCATKLDIYVFIQNIITKMDNGEHTYQDIRHGCVVVDSCSK